MFTKVDIIRLIMQAVYCDLDGEVAEVKNRPLFYRVAGFSAQIHD